MAKETRSFNPQSSARPPSDPGENIPALEATDDNPQEDWGAPMDEGATYSANHTRRPIKTEAERGQGPKTRAASKDQISRRS